MNLYSVHIVKGYPQMLEAEAYYFLKRRKRLLNAVGQCRFNSVSEEYRGNWLGWS